MTVFLGFSRLPRLAARLLSAPTDMAMKPLMLLGALIGFLSGIVLGLVRHGDWSDVLWRSMLAALVLGLLLRWWGRRWVQCVREAQQERLAALMAQPKDTQPSSTKKS